MGPATFDGAAAVVPAREAFVPALAVSFLELLDCMHDVKVAAVLEDLDVYERTGHMTLLIEDTIRRAQCLAEADRIIATF
jgi:hypothetical protein